jgi:hypothetical protein
MKALNTKLVFAAIAIAMLAGPAFAQQPQRHAQTRYQDPAVTYDSGTFTPHYVPGFGNVDAAPYAE